MKRNTGYNSTFAIGGSRASQTVLWLQKVQFSASTFVLKSPPIVKLQSVISHFKTTPNLTLLIILTAFLTMTACSNWPDTSDRKDNFVDTTKSFRVDNYWATPKKSFDFNSLGKPSADTLHLVTCSQYVYYPFGLLNKKSDLKTSLLKQFTISNCKREAYMNHDISEDSLWSESFELTLGRNKLNIFLDNDPEASTHSYLSSGEIYDSKVDLLDDIKIGMNINEFYKSFFDYFPTELENTFKVIKFESCVQSITHIYIFNNGKLSIIKFVFEK